MVVRTAKVKEREKLRSLQSPVGIACFTHLWKAAVLQEGREPMFSVLLVFTNKQHDELKSLRVACIQAAKRRWGEDDYLRLKAKQKMRMPWREAAEYAEYGAPFIDGNVMINFKTNTQPGIVDSHADVIINQSEIYSGCKMRVSYAPWAYEQKGNTGVTLLLNNCQKVGEGKRLSGRLDPQDEFEALDTGDFEDEDDDALLR